MLRRKLSRSSTSTSRIRGRFFRSARDKIIFYGKYILFAALIILLVFSFSKLLTIKTITCTTNEGSCSPDIENLFTHLKGKSIVDLNEDKVNETIKNIFPVENVKYSFRFPSHLLIEVTGWQSAFPVQTYYVSSFPALSMDIAYLSSDSGTWRKPSGEINEFLVDKEYKGQKLWSAGRFTPENINDERIKQLIVVNPTEDMLSEFYKLILLSKKYLENPQILIFGSRILLSQESLPDIIINIPADLGQVESALQSIDYLYTIKKDAKVIDLSFKHPIIK